MLKEDQILELMSTLSRHDNSLNIYLYYSMLRIGRKNNEIQTKEILDTGWEDITSVCMWIGMVEKYNFDKVEAERQIDLLTTHLGSTIDTYDKEWLDCYKKCDMI